LKTCPLFGGNLSLAGNAVTISGDRTAVNLTLPEPALTKPNIDHDKSRVVAEERGLVNRVDDAFRGDPNRLQQLNSLGEEKLSAAAKESDLTTRAKTNVAATLSGMLRTLGFARVSVMFSAP
jgi:hypothetical protein